MFDVIKEHWEKGAVAITLAFELVVAFEHHLAEVSFETRFLMVGFAGLVASLSVAEMLRYEHKPSPVGFHAETTERPNLSVWSLTFCVVTICAVSAPSVFLLNKTATFHNIRLLQRTLSSDATVGEIEIQPAHRPTNLTVSLSTNQARQIKIVDKAPSSWNRLDPVEWRMQNETPYGVTLFLQDFKSPQVFGCWYRLSAADGDLEVEVSPSSPEVRVLRTGQLDRYQRNAWIFGGFLCVVALVFWSYRSSWCRPSL